MADLSEDTSDKKKKLLIVEDDFFIRDLYQIEAVNQGLDVIVAVDGKDALEKVKEESPDIILLDLMLPKANGIAVLTTIKTDEQSKDTPVIVITNIEDSEKEKEAIQAGASAYLLKINNTPGTVIEKVKEYLQK